MTKDEIELVARARPEVAPYSPDARRAARARLAWDRPRRSLTVPLAFSGALVTAAAGAVIVAQLPDKQPAEPTVSTSTVVALPTTVSKMSAEEVLGRAAKATGTELDPRPDQFIQVSSETMYGAFRFGDGDQETRYLYRTKRTIWQSADGTKDGSLKIEHLTPKAYPGWPIPPQANEEAGKTEMMRLPACTNSGVARTDYEFLKTLPTGTKAMREFLYNRYDAGKEPGRADSEAWTAMGDLLRETYVPAEQRAALFRAAATIPGVIVTENEEDAAGRKGIGVGLVSAGVREDIIIDPTTYEYLGERGVVVNAEEAKSPVGSLVASTAQLEMTVADTAPVVDDPSSSCGEVH
ncbi:CU044_5270 family protein [Streptosporangiaceae bacterium NEAU-GS5]|nr:CU044_5270 family protein [Streptosporangiaceae bacterium NEAU-GS5]